MFKVGDRVTLNPSEYSSSTVSAWGEGVVMNVMGNNIRVLFIRPKHTTPQSFVLSSRFLLTCHLWINDPQGGQV